MNFADTINAVANPTGFLLEKAFKKGIEKFMDIEDDSTIDELEQEERRQMIASNVIQAQARTEQEFAIARRIDNAEVVEIEEYYDLSGNGSASASASQSKISLGLSAEGRRVSKRIYKFKGMKPIEQDLQVENT